MVTKEELMDSFWKIYDNDNTMKESEKDVSTVDKYSKVMDMFYIIFKKYINKEDN